MSTLFTAAAEGAFQAYIDSETTESSPRYLEAAEKADNNYNKLRDAIPDRLHHDLFELDILYGDRQYESNREFYYQGFADGIKLILQAFGHEGRGIA